MNNNTKPLMIAALATAIALTSARADERRFTYTYEPEVLPKGAMEFEQWVTLRTQRNDAVDQENYNRFELREEIEYGVTDRYTVGFYLNTRNTSFREVSTGKDISSFEFKGISFENRYMVLNPADSPIGLTLYLEPTFQGDEAALEQKIIIGQRHGDWKWAFNLVHETEWEENFHETVGELEFTFGLTRDLSANWSLGLEIRNHNELPEYKEWESAAFYVGPVVSYRQEKWYATLSLMPQVFGRNYDGNLDGRHNLELEDHERYNIRLIFGINF